MITHILDTSAMVAYLNGEPGGERVRTLLGDSNCLCAAHAVNLCEVYYQALRNSGKESADTALTLLDTAGVLSRSDMDVAFWKAIGDFKVVPGRLSIADCFGFVLAQREGAIFVTSDHHEFDRIVALGYGPILFIR